MHAQVGPETQRGVASSKLPEDFSTVISGAPGPVGSASSGCQGVCIPHKLSGNPSTSQTEHTLCNADADGWRTATIKERKEWLPNSPQRSVVSLAEDMIGLGVMGQQKTSRTNNDQDSGGGSIVIAQVTIRTEGSSSEKSHVFSH